MVFTTKYDAVLVKSLDNNTRCNLVLDWKSGGSCKNRCYSPPDPAATCHCSKYCHNTYIGGCCSDFRTECKLQTTPAPYMTLMPPKPKGIRLIIKFIF